MSSTQTFAILFRPSADSVHCASSNGWWDGACHNGLDTNITFNLAAQSITLPRSIIYGISYDTQNQGPSPTGNPNDPTNPLNIAIANDPTDVTAGSSTVPGTVFMNMASDSALRCDPTSSEGIGTFAQVSSACWQDPQIRPTTCLRCSSPRSRLLGAVTSGY